MLLQSNSICLIQQTENNSTFTGVKTIETPAKLTGERTETLITEVTFEEGKPVDVNFDIRFEDGTMKYQASLDGKYGMDKVAKEPWHKQSDLLEEAIKNNNFDLNKITYSDEAGHTDAVSGVSINVKPFIVAVQEVLDNLEK